MNKGVLVGIVTALVAGCDATPAPKSPPSNFASYLPSGFTVLVKIDPSAAFVEYRRNDGMRPYGSNPSSYDAPRLCFLASASRVAGEALFDSYVMSYASIPCELVPQN